MSRASESELDKLHGLLATGISAELARAIERAEANPDDPDKAISAALLNQVTNFLKLTGVTAPASSKRVKDVEDQLAELGVDVDNVVAMRSNRPK
ncbi:hypothetical protein WEU32_06850 [Brevundimonas sp. BH3]|uniref:hypothetical protein n=1 Tax=Brevundimonas sp. BH3 TaxID=3133089 RepID=UPI00324E6254